MTDSRADAAAREIVERYDHVPYEVQTYEMRDVAAIIAKHYAPVMEELSAERAMRAIDLQTMEALKAELHRLKNQERLVERCADGSWIIDSVGGQRRHESPINERIRILEAENERLRADSHALAEAVRRLTDAAESRNEVDRLKDADTERLRSRLATVEEAARNLLSVYFANCTCGKESCCCSACKLRSALGGEVENDAQ